MSQFGMNPYELLDDEAPRQQQKAAAPAPKAAKPAANKPVNQSNERSEQPRSNRGRGDNQRGGRGGRGGAARTPRQTGETVTPVDTDASAGGYSEVSGDHEKRNRSAGRGRGHGGRGRGFGDGSRREFDRRGAPRGRAPHADRKGGHNLGDPIDSQQESSEAAAPAVDGEAAAAEEVVAEEPAVEIQEVEFVPEDNSLTYDEYLAQQRERAVADDLADRVRPVMNDDSQWKAVKPLHADKNESQSEAENRQRKEKKNKGKVSLDQFVGSPVGGPPPREHREFDDRRGGARGGRGGRGGNRGGENRGGRGRGGNFQQRSGPRGTGRGANINVNDESAFPTLGGK